MAYRFEDLRTPYGRNVSPFCKSKFNDNSLNPLDKCVRVALNLIPLASARGFIPVFIARKIFIFNEIGRGERI